MNVAYGNNLWARSKRLNRGGAETQRENQLTEKIRLCD
jgi:hypothetical protein